MPGALESIDYHYDGHGTLASLSMKCYNRSVAEYYYLRNTLGDVVALCDAVGNIVAAYEYDAWGGVHGVYDGFGVNRIGEQDFAGNLNPIRYRGYYYDTETALYYLQSRYFDPGTGRFVNADSVSVFDEDQDHLLQYNLYTYCLNNPIFNVDPSGHTALPLVGALGGLVAVGSVSTGVGALGGLLGGVTAATVGAALLPVLLAVVAVAAIGVAIYFGVKEYNKQQSIKNINNQNLNKTVREILKTKRGEIKNAPLKPGSPDWNSIMGLTLGEVQRQAQQGDAGYKTFFKLLTDGRFNK